MTSYGAIALARAFSFNDAFFHLNTVYGFGYFVGHTALPLTMWALIDWIIRRRRAKRSIKRPMDYRTKLQKEIETYDRPMAARRRDSSRRHLYRSRQPMGQSVPDRPGR